MSKDTNKDSNPLDPLLRKALRTLQNPFFRKDPTSFDTLSTLLHEIKFFRTRLEAPANTHDFVEFAKYHVTYEVFPFGTVLVKEDDYADKLYIVLKGEVLKLQKRSNREIEEEAAAKRISLCNFDQDWTEGTLTSPGQTRKGISKPIIQLKKAQTKFLGPNQTIFLNTEVSKEPTLEDASVSQSQRKRVKGRKVALKTVEEPSMLNLMESEQPSLENLGLFSQNTEKGLESPKRTITSPKGRGFGTPKGGLGGLGGFGALLKSDDEEELELEDMDLVEESDDEDKKKQKEKEKAAEKERRRLFVVKLIKYIAQKNPRLKKLLYLADIIKVQGDRSYYPGDSFGENFMKNNPPKENCFMAVASEEAHVLVLNKASFNRIMDDIYLHAQEKVVFFMKLFPSWDKAIVEKFAYHFFQLNLRKDEVIYKQGELAKKLYVVREGEARLYKEIKNMQMMKTGGTVSSVLYNSHAHPHQKHGDAMELPITSITKAQFFGDELLLKQKCRQHTAIAKTSETIVYFIDCGTLSKMKEGFGTFFATLREQTKEKFDWRQQRAQDLLGLDQLTQMPGNKTKLESSKSTGKLNVNLNNLSSALCSPVDTPSNKNNQFFPKQTTSPTATTFFTEEEENESGLSGKCFKLKKKTISSGELAKNMEKYKSKFSRKVRETTEENENSKRSFHRLVGASLERNVSTNTTSSNYPEFNIAKELAETTSQKLKLPSLSISKSMSPKSFLSAATKTTKVSDFTTFLEESQLKSFVVSPRPPVTSNLSSFSSRAVSDHKKFGAKKMLLAPEDQVMNTDTDEYGLRRVSSNREAAQMINFNDLSLDQFKKPMRNKGLRSKLQELWKNRVKKEVASVHMEGIKSFAVEEKS